MLSKEGIGKKDKYKKKKNSWSMIFKATFSHGGNL
jgi:hypothetical protein